MPGATDVRIVLVTTPDEETAVSLSRTLVDERLVACGNLMAGIRSVFRWEGSVQDESETLVVFKTSRDLVPALLRRVPELHPYDVPEVLVVDVDAGHPAYLQWVAAQTREAAETSEQEGA